MKIGNQVISNKRIFIIAEIGNNHNGSFDRAIDMIDEAIESGADCVKFQMRHMEKVYRKKALKKDGEDLGTEYVVDLLHRFELSKDDHVKLFNYAKKKGITYMCTPWDGESINFLENLGVEAYKVASADLTNTPLIKKLIDTKKPLILSTGMSTIKEVEIAANILNKHNAEYVFLHCNSTYPAPIQDINLKWIHRLKKIHSHIGYSGHERGINISLAAASFDICVIERHFTQDRDMEGPDHAASLTKNEFAQMVNGLREIEQALGGHIRTLSQGEMINRENLSKSLVSSRPLSKGHILNSDDILVRSPGQGVSPQRYEELLGKELKRDMDEEDYFFQSDIDNLIIKSRKYKFSRPWGVPVRHHDFEEYNEYISPDIFEFHLSYSDMDLNLNDYLNGKYKSNFVVHAPELFEESHLLDLATDDATYREKSVKNMQRVINVTRELKEFFPNTSKPMIVTNIGGFSMDAPFTQDKITNCYSMFEKSLSDLDAEEVEIIPQTMAPFPWHFGGQRYQNLFVHADEILYWCEKLDLRMCFDISHSSLACNHFKYDFYEFAEKVASVSSHLHIGDARGVNGEGLQIGDGDIDFKKLFKILDLKCSNASFIPEIWQGHKNKGSGFWIALDKLENILN